MYGCSLQQGGGTMITILRPDQSPHEQPKGERDFSGGFEQARLWLSLFPRALVVFSQQVGRIEFQDFCNLLDRFQARVIAAALKSADIGPIEACRMRKSLLRKLFHFPSRAKIACKTLLNVHRTYNSQLQRILHGVYSSSLVSAAKKRRVSPISRATAEDAGA